MTGGKTLGQVRAELEAALGAGPAGAGEVAESLRQFLAAGPGERVAPDRPPQPAGVVEPAPSAGDRRSGVGTSDPRRTP